MEVFREPVGKKFFAIEQERQKDRRTYHLFEPSSEGGRKVGELSYELYSTGVHDIRALTFHPEMNARKRAQLRRAVVSFLTRKVRVHVKAMPRTSWRIAEIRANPPEEEHAHWLKLGFQKFEERRQYKEENPTWWLFKRV